jgi:DNA-binding XRE family transcriptional regulator
MIERGRMVVGEESHHAKLTEADVLWVREQTDMTQRAMAAKLGVSQSAISFIRQGKHWKHLL